MDKVIIVRDYVWINGSVLSDVSVRRDRELAITWPDYSIRQQLSIELSLLRAFEVDAHRAIETVFGDRWLSDCRLEGPRGTKAAELLVCGLRHRQAAADPRAEALNRVTMSCSSTKANDLMALFEVPPMSFGILRLKLPSSFVRFVDLIEATPWPEGSIVHMLDSISRAQVPHRYPGQSLVIEIEAPDALAFDLRTYHRIAHCFGSRLESLDVCGQALRRRAIRQNDLAAFIEALTAQTPRLRSLSTSIAMEFQSGRVGRLDIPISGLHGNVSLETLEVKVLDWPFRHQHRGTGAGIALAGHLLQLCHSKTSISIECEVYDYYDDESNNWRHTTDDGPGLGDLMPWMLELSPRRLEAIMQAGAEQLFPSRDDGPRPWRALEFDTEDQPIPLQYSRMAKELATRRLESTAESEEAEMARRRLRHGPT